MIQNLSYKIAIFILTSVLSGSVQFVPESINAIEPSSIERVTGTTEMETAIEIAMKLNPGIAPAVILASPTSYYDALAGIPLAQQKQAPILWVGQTPKESEAVFDHIKNHCDKDGLIYILGNDNSIPKSFDKALKKLGYQQKQIVRLGGSNHYETAIKIAEKVEYKGNPVIISSGENYSQVAGIAAMATAKESPILFLPSKGKIPQSVTNYLNSIVSKDKISIQIIGDRKTIPDKIVSELKSKVKGLDNDNISRISGKTPYELMAKVNEQTWFNESEADGDRIPVSSITLTEGTNYANTISGAILAAQNNSPLIFIDEAIPKSSLSLLKDIYNWNEEIAISYRQVTVLGDLPQKAVIEADSLFTLGKSLEGNAQVWTYAEVNQFTELNYGVIGEDNSIIVSDHYFNTLHKVNNEIGNLTLTKSSDVDEYGKPIGAYKDGLVTEAMFNSPSGIARDKEGILYIADTGNGAIRTIDQNRNVKTLVKGLKHPTGIVLNSKGDIFVTETLGHRILKIDDQGNWTVFAGGGYFVHDGERVGAFADGNGEEAKFNEPRGLAIDNEDNLYVADSANQRIRKVNTEGTVSTIAGSGIERIKNTPYIQGGYKDGAGENARFNFPLGLAIGPDKTIYVADTYNHCIRMITPEGVVSTLAGSTEAGAGNGMATLARFNYPSDVLLLEDGRLIIVDKGNALLRAYQPPRIPGQMGFSITSLSVSADNRMATLENVEGGVFVKMGGGIKEFKGTNGMDITQGDSVRTDQEGSATLIFSTGSKLSVGPNTSFTMNKLKETKAPGGKISIRLDAGTLWNSVKSLINEEDEYEIVTISVGAKVRGTLFLVSVDPSTGQQTTSVLEGSIRVDSPAAISGPGLLNQNYLLQMGQSGTALPPQQISGSSIYNPQFPSTPPPPSPPQPIDTRSLIQNQAPSTLANMAMDMVDRMQELQRQSEALMTSYQNTNNPAYLQSALQQSQVNSLLTGLNQQFMGAIQGSPQEQQMNQLLQRQNRRLDALRQQAQQLQEQAQQMRNNTENAARQAGLSPEKIQQLLQNSVTAAAAAGSSRAIPPPVIMPSSPPSNNGTGAGFVNVPGQNQNPGQNDDYNPVVPISDLRSTSVSGSSITLVWSVAQNPEHIGLKTSYDGQNWTDYIGNHTIAVTGNGITIDDLHPNTKYYFRIVIAEGNNRGASNMISITTDKMQLTGISDITGTVRVGETIGAGTITPDNATVTYQWQISASADGAYEDIVGENDNQYIISTNDMGKFIRVAAAGTGDYSGTVISNQTEAVAEPIPISWLLPKPTVSFNTVGDTPQMIVDYIANQKGVVYYMLTTEDFTTEEEQELIELMISDQGGNNHILIRGSEPFSSEKLEQLEVSYSEEIYANKSYNFYMVLKGVNNTYSEVERLTFSTPEDEKPPVLAASLSYNPDTNELIINHLVTDYDEFYDLYIWAIPTLNSPNSEPTAQEVKIAGKASQREYLGQLSRFSYVETIISDLHLATDYIVYLVAQDRSDEGENGEGLFSEVKQFTVTTPEPSTE